MIRFASLIVPSLFLVPVFAQAATLYIDPGSGIFGVGDTFVASVRLTTEGDCVNAAGVTLTYPKESLKAVDFSRGSSIISLWVGDPKIDQNAGTVTFEGGVPGGYCGAIA